MLALPRVGSRRINAWREFLLIHRPWIPSNLAIFETIVVFGPGHKSETLYCSYGFQRGGRGRFSMDFRLAPGTQRRDSARATAHTGHLPVTPFWPARGCQGRFGTVDHRPAHHHRCLGYRLPNCRDADANGFAFICRGRLYLLSLLGKHHHWQGRPGPIATDTQIVPQGHSGQPA